MTKKAAVQLEKQTIALLIAAGFSPTPNHRYNFTRNGDFGEIGISVRNDKRYQRRGYDVSLFGMYMNPDKARKGGIDCNPYSGKYNWLNVGPENIEHLISQYR